MSAATALAPTTPANPSLTPDEIRRQRGFAIAALCYIRPEGKDNRYRVPSQTGNGHYLVSIDPKKGPGWRCDCRDFEARNEPCKHVYAVQCVIEREKNADGTTTVTRRLTVEQKTTLAAEASPARPTYKQNWAAYNLAQTTEKRRFLVLLGDLCRGIAEPARPGDGAKGGRPPVPLADRVFACAFKVYSGLSGRRFSCDMEDAEGRGYVTKAPHYNSIARFLESPELTPVLGDLIAESALPLRAVETDFAIDSSGFASSRFVRWFDKKYGVVKEEHDWVKVSLMTGIKTNVVTAVRVGRQYSADSPEFIPLVEATARHFTLNEVSADKAYASYDNFEAVEKAGGTPYIMFRATATGRDGGTYARMYHAYCLDKDAYLAHYHKRSNVESTFSMIKAKFGDGVKSKTHVAMVNEALCKVLCHNLCCLILSNCELGIEAKFWGADKAETQTPAAGAMEDEVEAWAWV